MGKNIENIISKFFRNSISNEELELLLNFILKDEKAKEIFLKIAKEAEEKHISDTVAAQFLVFNHKEFEHLHYNTVRRYFKDYRYGLIR